MKGRGLKRRRGGEQGTWKPRPATGAVCRFPTTINSKRYCEISSLSQVLMKTVTVKTPTVGENCIFKHDLGHNIDV